MPFKRKPVEFIQPEQFRDWQKALYDMVKDPSQKHDPRKIIWVWDLKGGSGKSAFCKAMLCLFPDRALIVNGKADDIYNRIFKFSVPDHKKPPVRDWPDIIMVDIPKCNSDHFRPGAIEIIKSGTFGVNKYEGGQVVMNHPWVCCFANMPPPRESFTDERFIEYDLRSDEEKLVLDKPVAGAAAFQGFTFNKRRRFN